MSEFKRGDVVVDNSGDEWIKLGKVYASDVNEKFVQVDSNNYDFASDNGFQPTKKKPYTVVKGDVDGYFGFVAVKKGKQPVISVGCFTGNLQDAEYRWSNDPDNAYHDVNIDPTSEYYNPKRVKSNTKRLAKVRKLLAKAKELL